ncbi:aminopeptidase N [Oceanospirillum linum]|uniref:Aminopeptidase N n=1 Tax=Oceanospirillum linum TaxID=966 RepID=A0A1T1H9Y0_OCELI|nr:aminopeptidase N [Oceanospirillum linum]OOV86615.1 aminopeptidase N [Oceanospirillum linum]SEG28242.1 aminopeptidase N [Oleiphilus messinensis]SMP27159.1 aminopeptidase N [Oceanospirillum linum]
MSSVNNDIIYLKDYLPPAFLIQTVNLEFDLSPHETRVRSTITFTRNQERNAGLPLELHGNELKLISVEIDGQPLSESQYQITAEQLIIPDVPDQFVLKTDVQIDPANNTSLEGLYRSNTMFCTQCEAEGFRKITYYPDRPDVMAAFTTTVIADKTEYPVLLSNGNPVKKGELDNNRHFVVWQDPFDKPAYLFALVAGDLQVVKDTFTTMSGREVALEIWVEPENITKCDHAMASLKAAMKWDEEVYGREYDLDIYMIVAVNDFNMGAMENKGLNIFNSSCVLARPDTATDGAFQRIEGVVAHEYFHNWSGNRVTCRDWFQLSLKEGFTVYRDQCFSADMNDEAVKRIEDVAMLRTAQFAEDAGPTAHPVRPDHFIEISNFYTLTIYEKGSEIVRMIANLLGPDLFRKGSDLYFERHDGQAVTVEDFIGAMADASGIDFSQFMRWYSQSGTPELTVSGHYDAAAQQYTLTIKQQTPVTKDQPEKLPLHIPVKVGLLNGAGADMPLTLSAGEASGAQGDHDRVLHLREAEQVFVFENIDEEPVPSLLRGFSAPVKLDFGYTQAQLLHLMRHDSDGFNRWDAGQRLAITALKAMVTQFEAGQIPKLDSALTEAYKGLFESGLNPAILAEMLMLPGEAYLAEQFDIVPVDAIHACRNIARKTLAETLNAELEQTVAANQLTGEYRPLAEDIAKRRLKNICQSYLMTLEADAVVERSWQQFSTADNMTDQHAALTALVHSKQDEKAKAALESFEQQWKDDALVMDQWFQVQASRPHPDALARVKALMEHPAFSLKNPNKVRSLISVYCNQNRVNFHSIDGLSYQFLADVVLELDGMNPQIASRLITPLTRWQKMDAKRQQLMQAELQRIAAADLSKDLFEVVQKALP